MSSVGLYARNYAHKGLHYLLTSSVVSANLLHYYEFYRINIVSFFSLCLCAFVVNILKFCKDAE